MKPKPVGFVICYARSGGTFLNKLMKKNRDIVVLSEAHPVNTYNNRMPLVSIAEQAEKWYGINVCSVSYTEQLKEIKYWCDLNQKQLVIRDWSYIDFSKSKINGWAPPCKSINLEILQKNFDVKKVAFVRDAIDVFLSTDHELSFFLEGYIPYLDYIRSLDLEVFKYEELCENPKETLCSIFEELGGDYAKEAIGNKVDEKNVMGDIGFSRGNTSNHIVQLPRKYASPYQIKKINSEKLLAKYNRLFGYNELYQSRKTENLIDYLFFKMNKTAFYAKKAKTKLVTGRG